MFWIIGFAVVLYFAIIFINFLIKLKKEITSPIPKVRLGRVCPGCGVLHNPRYGLPNIMDSAARDRYWKSIDYCDKCVRKIM